MNTDLFYEEVPYKDIVANWENRHEWSEWKKCIYIALNIPKTEVSCSVEEKIWRFVNNWQKECAVAKALGIKFYDDTHNCFHSGSGLPTPDFIDKKGKTYELKNTKKYAYNDRHWWGADYHLYYDEKENVLYEQIPDGSYIAIMDIAINAVGVEYDKN